MNNKDQRSSLCLMREFICTQTIKPLSHITFWMYMIIGIIVLGGLGFWFEFFKYLKNKDTTDAIKTALIMFAPPLLNTSAIQMCLSKKKVELHTKSAVFFIAFFVNLACFFLLFFDPLFDSWSFILTMVFILVVTIWIALLQSSLNEDLYDFSIEPLGPDPNETQLPESKKRKVQM